VQVIESEWDYACEIHRVTTIDLPEKLPEAEARGYLQSLACGRVERLRQTAEPRATTLDGFAALEVRAPVPLFYKVTTKSRYGSKSTHDISGVLTCVAA